MFQPRAVTKNRKNISAQIKNCELEVLATRADFGEISEVGEVSVSRQDRRKVERALFGMIFTIWGHVSRLSRDGSRHVSEEVSGDKREISKDLWVIGKLSYNEEYRLYVGKGIGELKGRVEISDGNMENQLGGKRKNWDRIKKLCRRE